MTRKSMTVNHLEANDLAKPKMESAKTARIFIITIVANLSAMAMGTSMAWTSPVGTKLKSDDTSDSPLSYPIDTTEDAWISSIMALGALASPFVASPLAEKIGRKWALLSSSLFYILACVLMLVATEVWVILLGRLMQGFGNGFVMSIIPMYVGEIATDNIRGACGSLMPFSMAMGGLYVVSIGPYVSYWTLQYFCLLIPLIFDAAFFFMPETPYYYVGKGRNKEALESLQFLRGQSAEAVQEEMRSIESMVQASMNEKGTVLDIVKNAGNRKALFICVGLITFQQTSGINAVLFNTESIFASARMSLEPAISVIIVDALQVVAAGMTPFVADRLGRKTILLTSAVAMFLGLAAFGVFFYIDDVHGGAQGLDWLPVTALIIYIVAFIMGFGPLPWAVVSEVFPPNVKSIATSMSASTCWSVGFLVAFFYPMLNALGVYYAFWLFAGCCVVAFFFVMFFVIETKGLSLQEIQDKLNN